MSTESRTSPGARERHILRKQANALFAPPPPPEAQRREARRRDQQEYNEFMVDLQQALEEASRLQGQVDSEVILDFKERLERLYVRSMSLGGDLAKARQALNKLLEITMSTLERGAGEDPVALQKLADEREARQLYFRLLEFPLVADLMRGDEIIEAHELIPTLLGEDEATLRAALELFEPDQLQVLAQQARTFAQQAATFSENHRARLQQLEEQAAQATPLAH